jgi:hypothetical protein
MDSGDEGSSKGMEDQRQYESWKELPGVVGELDRSDGVLR